MQQRQNGRLYLDVSETAFACGETVADLSADQADANPFAFAVLTAQTFRQVREESMTGSNEVQQKITGADRRLWPEELVFSEDVYVTRLRDLQDEMAREDLQLTLLFDPENIFWLTGYQTIGYFTFQALIVPHSGKPVMLTRVVNYDMALAMPTIGDAVPVFDTQDHLEILNSFLHGKASNGKIGYESKSRYLNIHEFQRLKDCFGDRLLAFDGHIEAKRMVKTEDELDRMRAAARAVETGMHAALSEIAPGKTDNDLAAAMYRGSIAAGSEYIGHPPMVVSGPRTALCFALWKRKTLQKGDVVLLEGAGCVDRYHAMMARSVVLGKASALHREAADALIEVLEIATREIKPGIPAREVDRACRNQIKALGLERYFKSRTAYGIGIGFPPNWAEGHIYSIRPEEPLILQPNMTFHIIPTIFRDEFGMAISDSVCVTENGCDLLTHAPRELLEVDC